MLAGSIPVRATVPVARALACALSALGAVALLAAPPLVHPAAAAAAAVVTVSGQVFEDLDGDGARDPDEPGLAGVKLTNGQTITQSDAAGGFTLEVERAVSRFVVLTVPRGYRATTSFYHRLGAAEVEEVAFGLAPAPETDVADFRFVHASDPQVADAAGGAQLGEALDEIAALGTPPSFVIITGDLVQAAQPGQFENAAAAVAASPLPIYPVFGDHDADPDSLRVRSYEAWFGPTCYSFDRGPYHFVVLNDVRAVALDGSFVQYDWLAADLAAAEGTVLLFTHFLPGRAEVDRYQALGVSAVFSGHWHANRTRRLEGITDFNTAPLRYAGIDRSSRGFRIVELGGSQVITRFRTGGVREHLTVVQPAAGATLPGGSLALRVAAYDTRYPELAVRYRLAGGAGEPLREGALVPGGGWTYTPASALDGLAPGAYTLTVEALAGTQLVASRTIDFTAAPVQLPAFESGAPWRGFRGDARGTGVAGVALELPLHLAWAVHAGGPTGLSSAVVAAGRVFLAHAASGERPAELVAFSAASGAELWRVPTTGDVKGTAAADEEQVIVITAGGEVACYDAASGALRWAQQLGDPAARFDVTSPTLAGGVVYAGGPSVTAALDAASGAELWRTSLAANDFVATIYSAPAVESGKIACGLYAGLFVLDQATGAVLWSRAASSRESHRSAALVDGVLYAAGDTFGSQRLRAIDAASGAELWSAPFPVGNANSAPAITAGAVVLGTGNGKLEAFDRTSGAQLWTYRVGDPVASGVPYQREAAAVTASPLVAGSMLVVGADDGRLHVVDATSGAALWSRDLGAPIRSSAAASGNQLWVTTTDGMLYAFVAGAATQVGVADPAPAPGLATAVGAVRPQPLRGPVWIPFTVAPGGGIASASGGAAGLPGSSAAPVEIGIFDVGGRRVRTLIDAVLPAGAHRVRWDGRDGRGRRVAAGVYFLRLSAGGSVDTAKLTVMR